MEEAEIKKFNNFFNSIPKNYLIQKSNEELERNKKDFEKMKEYLDQGKCSFCGHSLNHFLDFSPCLHWLFYPKKFKPKKHFLKLYSKYSYHQIEAYLRWIANSDKAFQNINDLKEEKSDKKFIETTIKYKKFEWSFVCSYSDLKGHRNSYKGNRPHCHFQMKINDKVVIKYSSFHILFNKYDEFCFAVERGEFDKIKYVHIESAGMQSLIENVSDDDFIDNLQYTEDEENAGFRTQVLITADKGKTIPGDKIVELLERQEKTGESMAKLAKEIEGVETNVFISPGEGVPKKAKRSKKKSR